MLKLSVWKQDWSRSVLGSKLGPYSYCNLSSDKNNSCEVHNKSVNNQIVYWVKAACLKPVRYEGVATMDEYTTKPNPLDHPGPSMWMLSD